MRGLPHRGAVAIAAALLSFLLGIEATAAWHWWHMRTPCFGAKPSLVACVLSPVAFVEAERASHQGYIGGLNF